MNALAELETKRAQEKDNIEAKIDKALNRQVEVVANGNKEKKASATTLPTRGSRSTNT